MSTHPADFAKQLEKSNWFNRMMDADMTRQEQTTRPQDVALLPFPQELVDALGDYGCARSDGVSEPVRLHRWQLVVDRIKEHARANVTAALASAQAREEELRAEVVGLRQMLNISRQQAKDALTLMKIAQESGSEDEARAERLEEALREARDYVASELSDERAKFAGYEHCSSIASIEADLARIDAALSTNAATQTGETNEAAE